MPLWVWKALCLMAVAYYLPLLILKGFRGEEVGFWQLCPLSLGTSGFIALQWLM